MQGPPGPPGFIKDDDGGTTIPVSPAKTFSFVCWQFGVPGINLLEKKVVLLIVLILSDGNKK